MAAVFHDGGHKEYVYYKNPEKDLTVNNLYVKGHIVGDTSASTGSSLRAHKQGTQNLADAGAMTTVSGWNFTTAGTHNRLSGFDTTTGVFTVPVAGDYLFRALIQWTADADGVRRCQFVSSTGITEIGNEIAGSAGTALYQTITAGPWSLAAGVTVSLQANHTAGNALDIQPGLTNFNVIRIL